MNDLPNLPNGTDSNQEQVTARKAYFQLRENLVKLQSAPLPDAAAIDHVVKALEQAQLNYKATHGLIGNNPLGDSPLESGRHRDQAF